MPIIAKLKRTKLVLNIQDLHPDVPIELGLIRNPLLVFLLRFIEKFGYRNSNGLAVICNQFKKHCISKGAKNSNIEVIPNWIDLQEIYPVKKDNSFKTKLGLSSNHFIVLYAGTIGLVAGAEIVPKAALLLQEAYPLIKFLFVGEGPAVSELKNFSYENSLENIIFMPFQAREDLNEVQSCADLSIVTLRRGKGRTSAPSKVLGYMAAAKAVIASVDIDSETANLIYEANAGIVVEPESAEALAEAIIELFHDSQRRYELGSNGRKFLEDNYQKSLITKKYIDFFEKLVGKNEN